MPVQHQVCSPFSLHWFVVVVPFLVVAVRLARVRRPGEGKSCSLTWSIRESERLHANPPLSCHIYPNAFMCHIDGVSCHIEAYRIVSHTWRLVSHR
jgi:hypothetical protein